MYSNTRTSACFSVTRPLPTAVHGELLGQPIWEIDDPSVLQALTGLLEFWGCHTRTATDLDSALALLADNAQTPALLLLDYRLPSGVTGRQVAAALRERLAQPVPCLLLTGDTAP